MSAFLPQIHGTVLFFSASWHPSHSQMSSIFTTALPALTASLSKTLTFTEYDCESNPQMVQKFNVTVAPTFVLLDGGGRLFCKIETPDPAVLTTSVLQLCNSREVKTTGEVEDFKTAVTPAPATETGINADGTLSSALKTKLQRLITSSPIMLFIKGSPSAPKCGFSRKLIEILVSQKLPFSSFDILNVNEKDVREGLKVYSEWPTYPQVYVKGELIGGLDIINEMLTSEEGSLSDQLDIAVEKSLDERILDLTKRSRIMLFMKGLPSAPKCGFSREIVSHLTAYNVPFDSFNILEDETVRKELKRISEWPTYPQLYVDGEFVGGLDIVRELVESGEFKEIVEGTSGGGEVV